MRMTFRVYPYNVTVNPIVAPSRGLNEFLKISF